VVAPYGRFLAAFPTLASCAQAPAAEVVRLWSGLGYNRRALNLHRTAVEVVASHGGQLPDDDRSLRALPGIGPYTARAVRTFAFGQDIGAVDTNGVRVLSRCVEGGALTMRGAQSIGDRLVPPGGAWAFNQAMFDLGATICRARPACERCPMRRICRWHRAGMAEPDPWRASPMVRSQSRFEGSDRQGRGRLLDALRSGLVGRAELAGCCGWPDDAARAERIAASLVSDGFARWQGPRLVLR
jgi:A/G-specific adenine glycosylase